MMNKTKIKSLVIIFVIIVSILSGYPAVAYDVEAEIEKRDAFNTHVATAKAAYYSEEVQVGKKWDTIANELNEALKLVPYRTDLYHIIANSYIARTLSTPSGNGMGSDAYVNQIISAYESILNITPNDTKALFMLAFWNHFKLNKASYTSASVDSETVKPYITKLQEVDPDLAARLVDFLTFVETSYITPLTDTLTEDEIEAYNTKGDVVIVTLGNALSTKGVCSSVMIGRLNKTIEIANQIPGAKIIVTGGVPQVGTNEGVEMKKYLINHGIDDDRIIDENHSRSTPDNLFYSGQLIDQCGAGDVILISSNTHVRRGAFCLKALAATRGYDFNIRMLPYMETSSTNPRESTSSTYSNAAVSFFDYDIIFN